MKKFLDPKSALIYTKMSFFNLILSGGFKVHMKY